MSNVQEYHCPSCGAPIYFNAEKQKFSCDYCKADFDIDVLKQLNQYDEVNTPSKYDWEAYQERVFDEGDQIDLSQYECSSCGASISGDKTLGSTICPYCGSPTILKEQFSGIRKPDYIIPFKLNQKQAFDAFELACKDAPFLPDEFKDEKIVEKIVGIYVPFWMFDCDVNGNVLYNGTKTTTWSDSDYYYKKTDHYKLIRKGQMVFKNVPVDGSLKAIDEYMEGLEPFDYNEAMDFDTAYLSGYLSDKYDVSYEACKNRANDRIVASVAEKFKETCENYSSVSIDKWHVEFENGKIRYALLPVYMLNIIYKEQKYLYAINGQTAKVVGVFPICNKKRAKFFLLILMISLIVSMFVVYMMVK